MRAGNITGISLALINRNGEVWTDNFGYSDESLEIDTTKDTVYRIGSLTKLFTAAAILQLAGQGKLDLNDPVDEHLSDFTAGRCFEGGAITLAQLLTHQSGLPHSYEPDFWSRENWRTVASKLSCDMMLYRPGMIVSYSNLGYTLLGNVIEKVSGEQYEDYIVNHIFSPLQMHSAGFESGVDLSSGAGRVMAHAYDESGKGARLIPLRDIPAGGMYANTIALSKFAQYLLSGETAATNSVFAAETINQMFVPQGLQNALAMDTQVGWGWFLKPAPYKGGGFIAEHNGATKYHQGQMTLFPGQRVGVILLANSGTRDILRDLSNDLLAYIAAPASDEVVQAVQTHTTVERSKAGFCEKEAISGYYHSEIGLVNVERNDQNFVARVSGRKIKLSDVGNGYFDPSVYLFGIIPLGKSVFGELQISLRCTDGFTYATVRDEGREFPIGYRVYSDGESALHDEWLGDYRLEGGGDKSSSVKVWREGNELFVDLQNFPVQQDGRTFLLSALDPNSARALYLGEQWGPVIQFEHSSRGKLANYLGFQFLKVE